MVGIGTPSRDKRISSQRLAAATVAVIVVGLLAWWANSDDNPRVNSTADPSLPTATGRDAVDRCILDVHEAAAGGDVRGYLDCFGEPLRSVLEQRVSDRSVDVVAGQLKAGNADLQSYATTERETPDPNTTRLVLERIYSDRVERLRAELRRVADDWKIVSLVPIGRVAPEIPFGTPVTGATSSR